MNITTWYTCYFAWFECMCYCFCVSISKCICKYFWINWMWCVQRVNQPVYNQFNFINEHNQSKETVCDAHMNPNWPSVETHDEFPTSLQENKKIKVFNLNLCICWKFRDNYIGLRLMERDFVQWIIKIKCVQNSFQRSFSGFLVSVVCEKKIKKKKINKYIQQQNRRRR